MSEPLQAEVERLRAEVESYRQREVAELRTALAAAREDAAHYRAEAQRNADLGRQIAAEYQNKITELQTKLNAREDLSNGRIGRRTGATG